jgi:two-component system, NtrC family, sensor histidine kinase GlrK
MHMHKYTLGYTLNATLFGAILGLGAPAGYFVYSHVFLNVDQMEFLSWCSFLIENQTTLLIYLTIPTVVVFSLFGCYHGVQESRLASKKAQMEYFLHIAAHDIRSPLTVVKEGVSQIEDEVLGPINPEQREFLELVSGQVSVMSELLTELLDLHKMETGKYQLERKPTDLIPLLKKASEEMSFSFSQKKGRITVDTNLQEPLVLLLDQFRVRQVIRNVIGNAIRYSPEQGVIEVRCERDARGAVEVTIANQGPHIPEEKLALIFDKFEQAANRDQKMGAGLGLSICKNIVELHGGNIWAVNVNPEGVRFHIRLPQKGVAPIT